ncbi:HpcH/HpaI aldolase/citrate lyase family protein [Agrococcus baldri]|uniref:Citryl-CoA lyase n=1 Tax=Agrococcus baldri TaxID=153730 RepID=A0AA87RGE2_9MICO|nr:aldolase/citrate lyase family protein [Agrococcus baldri]GEK79128.1 citryl-CoA lyase [Agrococcus baldri]
MASSETSTRTAPDLRLLRSVMETPLLDERKWAKIPQIPADAFIIDLEDSVVPAQKELGRTRAVEALAQPDFFGTSLVFARANNLATPWGREDIAAFAEAGVEFMLYPKAQSLAEVESVLELLDEHGSTAQLLPIIETAGALRDVGQIALLPRVAGLYTGIGDMSVDAGVPFYIDGEINPVLSRARDSVAFAAAAGRVASTDTVYARDLRNQADVLDAIKEGRSRGFTTLVSFYPPHIPLINEHLLPAEDELADARWVVEVYEAAQQDGRPAVATEDGRTILLLDYTRAQQTLARASAEVPKREASA